MDTAMSQDDIQRQITIIRKHRDNKRFAEAWALMNQLCADHPDDAIVWRTASHLASYQGNLIQAIEYISKCIELMPNEPAFPFKRCLDLLCMDANAAALADADTTLRLSEQAGSIYYTSTALFFKAEALFRLGHKQEARAIALDLPSDMGHWLQDGMRTREDILNDTE